MGFLLFYGRSEWKRAGIYTVTYYTRKNREKQCLNSSKRLKIALLFELCGNSLTNGPRRGWFSRHYYTGFPGNYNGSGWGLYVGEKPLYPETDKRKECRQTPALSKKRKKRRSNSPRGGTGVVVPGKVKRKWKSNLLDFLCRKTEVLTPKNLCKGTSFAVISS